MIKPQRLPNGNLWIPMPAYGEDGIQGDGLMEVPPGTELYDMWLPFVEDGSGEPENGPQTDRQT